MAGLEQFLELFGNVTVTGIVTFVLAIFFGYRIYKEVVKFLDNKKNLAIQKHEAEKKKDEQLKSVLEEVSKYPEYREQSRAIQKEFRDEIDGLRVTQQSIQDTLKNMQERQDRRERNKLRNKLLQSYRYYTDLEKNPSQSWTRMESEAFWELFKDYEDAGGDGYMHTVVQPAMSLLKIIDI